jgi:hypothetical protein
LLVMARARRDDHRRSVGDLGARVDITVVPGPRGPTLWERIALVRNRRAIACLAAATVVAGALAAGVSVTGHGGARRLLPTTVLPNTVLRLTYLRPTGPAAAPTVSAHPPASAYPLRCLSLLIAMHDPSLMSAAFDRNLPCGRPRGPYTLIAVGARQSGGRRRAPPSTRSPRGLSASPALERPLTRISRGP